MKVKLVSIAVGVLAAVIAPVAAQNVVITASGRFTSDATSLGLNGRTFTFVVGLDGSVPTDLGLVPNDMNALAAFGDAVTQATLTVEGDVESTVINFGLGPFPGNLTIFRGGPGTPFDELSVERGATASTMNPTPGFRFNIFAADNAWGPPPYSIAQIGTPASLDESDLIASNISQTVLFRVFELDQNFSVLSAIGTIETVTIRGSDSGPQFFSPPSPSVILFPAGGGIAQFDAGTVFGTPAPTLQWRRDGIDLVDGNGISGATTSVLTIDADATDQGIYTCVATNQGGTAESDGAELLVLARVNPFDFNDDGVVNVFDLTAFLDGLEAFLGN
ncbi:MAG: immunoglobulin domain-containing protein [Planctomycetota bacterium]